MVLCLNFIIISWCHYYNRQFFFISWIILFLFSSSWNYDFDFHFSRLCQYVFVLLSPQMEILLCLPRGQMLLASCKLQESSSSSSSLFVELVRKSFFYFYVKVEREMSQKMIFFSFSCVCQEVRCYLPLASYRNHHHQHQQHHNHDQVGGTMPSLSKEMSYYCNLN